MISDQTIENIINALHTEAIETDKYCYGLPVENMETLKSIVRAVISEDLNKGIEEIENRLADIKNGLIECTKPR